MIRQENLQFYEDQICINDSIRVQKFWVILSICCFLIYSVSLIYGFLSSKDKIDLSIGLFFLMVWITIFFSSLKRSYSNCYKYSEIRLVKVQSTNTSTKINFILKNSKYRKIVLLPDKLGLERILKKLRSSSVVVEECYK